MHLILILATATGQGVYSMCSICARTRSLPLQLLHPPPLMHSPISHHFCTHLPSPLCCPQISAFFPGHHMKAMAQDAEMRKLEGEVAALLAGAAPWCAG